MKKTELEPCIEEAVDTIFKFVTEITGQKPTQQEVARNLKKYFVLNEIAAHIKQEREEKDY